MLIFNGKIGGIELSRVGSGIRLVTFDLWQTLLFEHEGENQRRKIARCRNLAEILNSYDVSTSEKQMLDVFKLMSSWLKSIWIKNREVTHLDQLNFIVREVTQGSISLKNELISKMSDAYVSSLFEVSPSLNPKTYQTLKWLREKDMFIGIICNTGRTPGFGLRRFLKKAGVYDFFDFMFFSDELGIRKPDPRIFHMATEKVDVSLNLTVHVGDNLESDVWGAKNVGMKAIYFFTEEGRDKTAEADPNSLISFSRISGNIDRNLITPDWTICSLDEIIEILEN